MLLYHLDKTRKAEADKLLRWVRAHFRQRPMQKDAARLFGWTPSHITYLRKNYWSSTWYEAICMARYARVRALLRGTNLQFRYIAADVRVTLKSLREGFRKYHGIGMRRYRTLSRKGLLPRKGAGWSLRGRTINRRDRATGLIRLARMRKRAGSSSSR